MLPEVISAECVQDQCRNWLTDVKADILKWDGKVPAQSTSVQWRERKDRQTVWDSKIEECFKRHFATHFTSSSAAPFNEYFQGRGDGSFQGFRVSLYDDLNRAVYSARKSSV